LDELVGVPTLAYEIGYNQFTTNNLLELWKLIDKVEEGLLGFDTTSIYTWCFKRVRISLGGQDTIFTLYGR